MMDPETLKENRAELEREKMVLSYKVDHLAAINSRDREALDRLQAKRLPIRQLAWQAVLSFASGVILGLIIYAIL
ncbi:MAG: hypothetical protein IIY82_05920 [Firmicutes bacterium]|nr:hypothetical protein [Bacillota bacterium]